MLSIFLVSFNLHAQLDNTNSDLSRIAELFKHSAYEQVCNKCLRLLEDDKENAQFHYYYGASLAAMGIDNEKALVHLNYCRIYNVPIDVYFYLGRVNFAVLRFDEAASLLQKYIYLSADSGAMTNVARKLLNSTMQNISASNTILNVELIDRTHIFKKEIDKHYQMMLEYSGASSLASVALTFKVNYPVFNKNEMRLYYSAISDSSLGGFDIYFRDHDSLTGVWSLAQSMPYPISSPANDYFYIPSKSSSFLATDRNTSFDSLTIYHIRIVGGTVQSTKVEDVPKYLYFNDSVYSMRLSDAIRLPEKQSASRDALISDILNKQYVSDSLRISAQLLKRLALTTTETLQADTYKNEAYRRNKMAAEAEVALRTLYKQLAASEQKMVFDKPSCSDSNIISEFDILQESPYNLQQSIPFDILLPDGIIYRVQIGSFGQPMGQDKFKGIFPLSAERIDSDVIKYFAGFFNRYKLAEAAMEQVRKQGFTDAYIVSYNNGTKINIKRAQELE